MKTILNPICRISLVLTAILLVGLNSNVCADNITRRQCLDSANTNFNNTLKAARDERERVRFICDAGSPERAACLLSCLQARNECLKPIDLATGACFDNADNVFLTSRQACRTAGNCSGNCTGNVAFLTCMVPVRVTLFNSRKKCRDADNRVGRRTCRSAFTTCNSGCKPAQ